MHLRASPVHPPAAHPADRLVKTVVGLIAAAALFATGMAGADTTVWIPGWKATSPLTTPRAGAAVVAAGDYLYALGGVDGRDFLASTEYARIREDGTLSPWRPTSPLTQPRGFFSAVAHRGYLYAAGGGNGPAGGNLLRSVERARIGPDGRLGPWEPLETALTVPRRCVKLVAAGEALIALGGFGGALLDTVERATLGPDGRPGPWRLEPNPMTRPRYVNAAKRVGDTLYVLGGHNEREGVGLAEVEYAVTGPPGSPLVWHATAAMNHGRYGLAAAAHDGLLYALGGLDGAVYTDVIEASRIRDDGSLGPWRRIAALSSPRANFGAVVHRDRLYVIGGTNRDGYYRTVEYADFDAGGALGFRGSPQEAAAYRARRAAARRGTPTPLLPNAGTVREIISTAAYSYMRVAGSDGERWIAAPRRDYRVGERIRFSRGVTMTNFRSRALGRVFDAILFVERTERAEAAR